MVNRSQSNASLSNAGLSKAQASFALTIDGKTYQVEVLRPGLISVDGNVYNVQIEEAGVRVNQELFVASLSEDFATVRGKLYDAEWNVEEVSIDGGGYRTSG